MDTINVHKQILDDFQNNSILFYQLTFEIWAYKEIFPTNPRYKFYASPPTIVSILFLWCHCG